jgi:tetratricopeptide (TPR) repeat protein
MVSSPGLTPPWIAKALTFLSRRVLAVCVTLFPAVLSVGALAAVSLLVLPAAAGAAPAAIDSLESLMKQGDYPGARALAEGMLASDPDNARALIILSQVYLTEEKGPPAVDAAKRAVEIEPSVADYRLWLARAYLLRAGQSTLLSLWYARKGKGEYEKAVELDPDNVQIRLELCLYYLLAPGIAGGNGGRAREEAAKIEEQSPLFGAYAWASVWEREKELDRAEQTLMRAVELDTTSTRQAMYALGYFYHRNRRLADARAVFEEILAENPDDTNAMYHIGTTYLLEEKELDRAEELLNVYLESAPKPDQPTHAMAHWRLGMVYELKGEKDLAIEHLEKAVQLNPENREFRATLDAALKE